MAFDPEREARQAGDLASRHDRRASKTTGDVSEGHRDESEFWAVTALALAATAALVVGLSPGG